MIARDQDWARAVKTGTAPAFFARLDPDRPAVIAPSGNRTFGELNAEANQLVRALWRRGLSSGDAVAILCSNRAEFAMTWAACARAGFRLTTINWHLTPGEAAYILADCDAQAFVLDARHVDTISQLARPRALVSVGGAIEGFETWAELTGSEDNADIDEPFLGTAMLYTSGTTGRPKGVHKAPDPEGALVAVLPSARSGARNLRARAKKAGSPSRRPRVTLRTSLVPQKTG